MLKNKLLLMFHVKQLLLIVFFLPSFVFCQHMGTTTLVIKELPSLPEKEVTIERFMDQFPEAKGLNSMQREWFYWTNYSRNSPRKFWDSVVSPLLKIYPNLRNAYSNSLKSDLYGAKTLPLLKPNSDLVKVAQKHANELRNKKALPSHTSPSGASFQDRMKSVGVKVCAGENISFGSGSVPRMLTLLYIDEGVPGLGHRKSLLSSSYVEMGVGISAYPDDSYMVIQDFACDQK